MAISVAPKLLGPLLIGGGITQSNPEMLKGLMQTFSSSPLTQILKAKEEKEDDKDYTSEEAEEAIGERQEKKRQYFGRINQEKIKEALKRRGFEGDEDQLEIVSGKILGDFDDTEISDQEADDMASSYSEFEGLTQEDLADMSDKNRTLNAKGGMIDRPLYDRA
jgi:hypothetical protein|tara:strand:- start:734 stop:1225 length:492 start_codon:yes stop_codon:yes gene_type:complete